LLWAGLALLTGAVLAAACSIYDSSLLLPASDGGGDGSSDASPGLDSASTDGGAEASDPCNHMLPPERPDGGDGTDDIGLIFAFNSLDVGLGVPLDLDRTCTCPAPSSCIPPEGGAPVCDGTRGQDDSFTKVFTDVGFPKASFSTGALYNMLLILKNYNGGMNDDQVTASFVLSSGREGVRFPDAGPTDVAQDGTDEWTVDPDTLFGGTGQNLIDSNSKCDPGNCLGDKRDGNAFVRDGVLVVTLDSLPSPSPIEPGRVVFDLKSVVITARIVANSNGTHSLLDGGLTGRWPITPLFHNVFRLNGCMNSANYQAFHPLVCKYVDIASDPSLDNKGAACDSVSAALGFSAITAKGGHGYRIVSDAGCDYVNDTCP